MKLSGILFAILALLAVLAAGCTSTGTGTPTTVTPAQTIVTTTSTVIPLTTPTFEIADVYMEGNFSFQSEKEQTVKEFRVVNPSWGIHFEVLPLLDDPQYCWFKIAVENVDSGRKETYGYGRDFSNEKVQSIPMYNAGPYKITMTGNKVKVMVIAGKRLPGT